MNVTKAGQERILLVEDNDDHAELVTRCFQDAGEKPELQRVCDGEEAIAWLDAQSASALPSLVLLDLRLPKVDGMEVLAYIKGNPRLAALPVVILTTSDADHDVARAYGSHANSYVVKPFDFSRLRAVVQTLGIYWLDINRSPGQA